MASLHKIEPKDLPQKISHRKASRKSTQKVHKNIFNTSFVSLLWFSKSELLY